MSKLGGMRTALTLPGIVAIVAGCAAIPPERQERDRAILAAIEPCKQRYEQFFFNVNMVSVEKDGRVRYWYRDAQVAESYEVDRCLSEAQKDLKVGPWAPGRLARAGPANVSITAAGRQVVVPARLNGVPGVLLLAPRSGLTYVKPAYAKRAGLDIVAESPTTYVRFAGGDKRVAVPFVRSRAIEIGDASVEALDIGVYQAGANIAQADGVLGNSFLSHFRVTIDRRMGRLTLEPLRAP